VLFIPRYQTDFFRISRSLLNSSFFPALSPLFHSSVPLNSLWIQLVAYLYPYFIHLLIHLLFEFIHNFYHCYFKFIF
jgi:hypothetical protein